MDAYPGKIRIVYKHFPLSFHQNARPASEAALFAKQQGKFWEMHELLFKNHNMLTMQNIKSLGRQVGLDEIALEASVTAQKFKAVIDKDIADGQKATVTGTPTLFINGKRLPSRNFDTFKRIIDEILAGKGTQPAAK